MHAGSPLPLGFSAARKHLAESQTLLLFNNARSGVCASSSPQGGGVGKWERFLPKKRDRGGKKPKQKPKKALTTLLLHPGSTGVAVCVGMVSAEGSLHLAARSSRTGTNAQAFSAAITILIAPGKGQVDLHVQQGCGGVSAASQAVPAPS